MNHYEQMLRRFRARWGDNFDPSGLCQKFVPYYNSGQRIKVKLWEDEEGYTDGIMFGRVSITTGWKPSFLLMLRSDSVGSPWLLDESCEILAVQTPNGKYIDLPESL